MRSDLKQVAQNQFWTRQMLEFIHPRYSLSKYHIKYGTCHQLTSAEQKQKCISQQKQRIDDMMIFAQYYKNKNTKCIEQGVLAGYDWKYTQKYCWGKIIKVMQTTYPLEQQDKQNLKLNKTE